jgi:hypothetical protein
LVLCACVDAATAPAKPPAVDGKPGATSTVRCPAPGAEAQVGFVRRIPDGRRIPRNAIRLGDTLEMTVCNLAQLDTERSKQKKAELTLFINGVDAGIQPEGKDLQGGRLRFHLERNGSNAALWRGLFRDPFRRVLPDVRFSVGVPGEVPLKLTESVATMKLSRLRITTVSWFVLALVVSTLVLLVVLAGRTDILRIGPLSALSKRQPYSLARTQMAWWFVLILAGYVVIWQISGDADAIPISLLALMGISAGTALGAVAIDASSAGRVSAARTRLTAEELAINAQVAMVGEQLTLNQSAQKAAVAPLLQQLKSKEYELQQELARHQADLGRVQQQLRSIGGTPTSAGFLLDVLTDEAGVVALHRLQVFVWTAVLGLWFVSSVVYDLSMPEFSATLLALMGISSGTYLGFKLPEKG